MSKPVEVKIVSGTNSNMMESIILCVLLWVLGCRICDRLDNIERAIRNDPRVEVSK